MQTTDKEHIEHLVALCRSAGLREVVLSPGSRNAPLIIAFDAHPDFKTYLIHDERSAAFFALGLAESLSRPVAICCTSGSAVLNYAPAIAEAYYRSVPLLILTADRPTELVDQGDGQTIRQKNVFHNYIKWQVELPNHADPNLTGNSDVVVSQALHSLLELPSGPVHVNIPLHEPLYGLTERKWKAKKIQSGRLTSKLSDETKKNISDIWARSTKRMILIGQQVGDYRPCESLRKLFSSGSVAVLAENTSNTENMAEISNCIDRSLAGMNPVHQSSFVPDLLITIGGAVISKRIKSFLRQNRPAVHWRVGHYHFEENSFDALSATYEIDEDEFFNVLFSTDTPSGFGGLWKELDFTAQESHHDFLSAIDFSDLKAYEMILKSLPKGARLHMANSSVVRYCQLFDPLETIRYYSNRGVSGIDGSSSTALGFANGSDELNVLISGDISFFYDSNVLWNRYLCSNFRIIVINNGGGGIFRYIPGPSDTSQLNHFVAPHNGNVQKLCAAFDVDYVGAGNMNELKQALTDFFNPSASNRPKVLEIDTTSVDNEAILKKYFANLGNLRH